MTIEERAEARAEKKAEKARRKAEKKKDARKNTGQKKPNPYQEEAEQDEERREVRSVASTQQLMPVLDIRDDSSCLFWIFATISLS